MPRDVEDEAVAMLHRLSDVAEPSTNIRGIRRVADPRHFVIAIVQPEVAICTKELSHQAICLRNGMGISHLQVLARCQSIREVDGVPQLMLVLLLQHTLVEEDIFF